MSEKLVIENEVLTGKEGWIFLWNGENHQFDHLLGKRVDPESVQNFVENLKVRHKFCAERNIKYLHLISPSKPIVMQDHLPSDLESKIQSLYKSNYYPAVLRDNLTDACLYPDAQLREMRKVRTVFQKTDTHMTDFGYATMVRIMLAHLGINHDPLFYMREVKARVSGDLAVMLGRKERQEETAFLPISRGIYSATNRQALKGNTGSIYITRNEDSISSERLLLIGDSFNLHSMPALSTYFRDIFYIRSPNFQPDLADALAPDVIITGNAERYLCKVKADHEASSVLMSLYGAAEYQPNVEFTTALRAQLAFKWYRRDYDSWVRKTLPYLAPGLGAGQLRMLHRDEGSPNSFLATGGDPWLVFNATDMQEDADYRLELDMTSSTASMAQMFIAHHDWPQEFSENRSIKHPVVVGRNKLSFPLPAQNRGKALRLDPLSGEGSFTLHSLELKTL